MTDERSADKLRWIVILAALLFFVPAIFMVRDCLHYPRQAQLRFAARVVKSEGVQLAVDTPCELSAQAYGNGRQSFVEQVELRCGGLAWQLAETYGGCAPQEQAMPGETRLRYRLICRAAEQLPKRHLPQHRPGFVLDTPSGTLRIQATSPSPSQISFSIDEYSTPVTTPRLVD